MTTARTNNYHDCKHGTGTTSPFVSTLVHSCLFYLFFFFLFLHFIFIVGGVCVDHQFSYLCVLPCLVMCFAMLVFVLSLVSNVRHVSVFVHDLSHMQLGVKTNRTWFLFGNRNSHQRTELRK